MPALKVNIIIVQPEGVVFPRALKRVRDVRLYKMATAGVPSGTILAVHLQKCTYLSNFVSIEFQYNKTINACTCLQRISIFIKSISGLFQ
jgi:hypothetical protein